VGDPATVTCGVLVASRVPSATLSVTFRIWLSASAKGASPGGQAMSPRTSSVKTKVGGDATVGGAVLSATSVTVIVNVFSMKRLP